MVHPDPWAVLLGFVVQDCGAQDDDVAEDSLVGALEKVHGKDCLPAVCPQMIAEWGLVGSH